MNKRGKMKNSNKKLSKKAERERRKEQKRLQELQTQIENEKLKKRNEHLNKLKSEREALFLKEEKIRLQNEKDYELKKYLEIQTKIEQCEQKLKEQSNWKEFMDCSDEYSINDVKQINMAITLLSKFNKMNWI
jgi:hypothetical protein